MSTIKMQISEGKKHEKHGKMYKRHRNCSHAFVILHIAYLIASVNVDCDIMSNQIKNASSDKWQKLKLSIREQIR